MTNTDSVLKSRDIALPAKVHIVKAMVFPVVTYGCENWTIKKAECWRIDALKLWFWRRHWRVPWTARISNQSILKEISPEYSLEDWCWSWSSNTLATWCEQLTHWKRHWCWKDWGQDKGWQRIRCLDGITDSVDMLLSHFSRVRLCETPQTAAHQAPPSLGFSRQEHWSGLPFPSPMHESEKWQWSRSVMPDS